MVIEKSRLSLSLIGFEILQVTPLINQGYLIQTVSDNLSNIQLIIPAFI